VLEEITCLSNASISLIVMVVEPSVAAAEMEEDPNFGGGLDLKDPRFCFGGRVGQCSRIWPIPALYSRTISKHMTSSITVLTWLMASSLLRGPSSCKSSIKLRSFIQIQACSFKHDFLNSGSGFRCNSEARTASYSGRRAIRT